MSEIEQWEPQNTDQALAVLDQWTYALDAADSVEEVAQMRTDADAVLTWIRRRDDSEQVALRAQEFMRSAERKLAELVEELREAGKVRKAGRPKKSVTETPNDGEESVTETPISPLDVFGDQRARRDALLFASVNEDEWREALAAARETGDLSRANLVRMLRTPASERASRVANGDTPTAGRVVPRAIRQITGAADSLEAFDAEGIEHEDRKEWKAALREQIERVNAWTKGLPR